MVTILIIIVIIFAIIVAIAVLKAKSQAGSGGEIWPFYAKKPLSQPEQILYFRLIEALPEHIVLA